MKEKIMSNDKKKIAPEDMLRLKLAKLNMENAMLVAEKASAQARVAVLEHQNLIQHIFINYGLSITDSIDDNTGEVNPQPPLKVETVSAAEPTTMTTEPA
jgi:hypothetical protein